MDALVEKLALRIRNNPVSEDLLGSPFRACPPVDEMTMCAEEARLGFGLPPLLRRIYREIANGGFGPGYGVMGVKGGFTDDMGHTAVDLYEEYRQSDPEDPAWIWPATFLPICHWGCVVYSVVDCARAPFPVFYMDVSVKEPDEPMDSITIPHKPSLEAWLTDWLDGKDLWAEVWGE